MENRRSVCRGETKSRPVTSPLSRAEQSSDSSVLERDRSEFEAVGRCAVVLADHAIPKTPSTTSPQPPLLPKSRLIQQAPSVSGACHGGASWTIYAASGKRFEITRKRQALIIVDPDLEFDWLAPNVSKSAFWAPSLGQQFVQVFHGSVFRLYGSYGSGLNFA